MAIEMILSVLGLLGGLLCAAGDILFDFKGKGNQKLGTSGNIDSNWVKMADWRFRASIICAFVGDIFAGLGIASLAMQVKEANETLAVIMAASGYIGVIGGFYIHSVLCIQPIIYKRIMEEDNFELADRTLESFYKTVIIPFIAGYASFLISSICVIIAVLTACLDVPVWLALFNPIVFTIIGMSLRKINPVKFADLPGIVMPSLGLGMIGLTGIINLF